jgi:hypothetical protein
MRISSTGNIGMGDVTTPISTDATLNIDQIGSDFQFYVTEMELEMVFKYLFITIMDKLEE